MGRDYTIEDWHKAFFAIDRTPEIRKKYMSKFKFNKKSRILEVGCSDGVNLEVFQSMGYEDVFGTDISIALLSQVKKSRKRICTNIYKMGIKDSSFDEIFCKGLLHHIYTRNMFGELLRILRPGGVIHICEPWPTLLRKIADFLTLFVLYPFSKNVYCRRIVLIFEREMYSYWLRTCKKTLFDQIRKHNLKVIYRHSPLINIYLTVQKEGKRR